MDAIDVVRGGGAVRYGPQSVGGVVNFVTRAIPQDFGIEAGVEGQLSPTSSQNNPKETHNLMVGGTADNGLAPRCSTPARAAVTGASTAPPASTT